MFFRAQGISEDDGGFVGPARQFLGEQAEIGINSAAGLPWRVMVTRDFSFCNLSITPRQVALNYVTEMLVDLK